MFFLLGLLFACLVPGALYADAAPEGGVSSRIDYSIIANRAEAQAIDAIEQGRMKEGLAFMRYALDLDPSAFRTLNYASVLFAEGASEFDRGSKTLGHKLLKEAENQLSRAIADFDPQEHAVFVAHAYFLLGEIYLHGFSDPGLAQDFYYRSIQYHDNEPSRKAVEGIRRGIK